MSLENDIQQPRFRNQYQKAMINLIYTFNWIMEHNKQFFDAHDITYQQFNILRILRGAGQPLSTLQIRQRMLDKMSDTSRIVDRLVKKELVQKVISRKDRRLVDISITEKGMHLLQQVDEKNEELDRAMCHLSEDEARELNHLLDKLRNSA